MLLISVNPLFLLHIQLRNFDLFLLHATSFTEFVQKLIPATTSTNTIQMQYTIISYLI